jgi:hypothetical protein
MIVSLKKDNVVIAMVDVEKIEACYISFLKIDVFALQW